jgi:hypothetical protein
MEGIIMLMNLFRGKRFGKKELIEGKEWVEGHLLSDNEKEPFIVRLANENDEPCNVISIMDIEYVVDYVRRGTICQYSGIPDIRGKDICENDVVYPEPYFDFLKEYENNNFMCRAKVEVHDGCFFAVFPYFERSVPLFEEGVKWEIVGNAIDQPQIIGEEE